MALKNFPPDLKSGGHQQTIGKQTIGNRSTCDKEKRIRIVGNKDP